MTVNLSRKAKILNTRVMPLLQVILPTPLSQMWHVKTMKTMLMLVFMDFKVKIFFLNNTVGAEIVGLEGELVDSEAVSTAKGFEGVE